MSASRSYRREYYIQNREAILQRVASYQRNNQDKILAYRETNGQRVAARTMVRQARDRASREGIPFDPKYITAVRIGNWLFDDTKCRACGCNFDFSVREKGGPSDRSATLDKVNNELGYVEGNVELLCWPCNKAKGTLDLARLERLVKWLRRRLR